ncbi:unnamed protein product [Urochloa humidicola]
MLGFFYHDMPGHDVQFMPTPPFCPPFAAAGNPEMEAWWRPVDACHGRVLCFDDKPAALTDADTVRVHLVVSHPFTGEERRITTPKNFFRYGSKSGAVTP